MKVIVVDDEASNRRLFSRLLGRYGCAVTTAATGSEALDIFITTHFHLAFLDVNLGNGMNGITLAGKLLELSPRIRVVMMSGDPENRARVAKAGLGKFLTKPFDIGEIAMLLERESNKQR